jgi:hypothetical protein
VYWGAAAYCGAAVYWFPVGGGNDEVCTLPEGARGGTEPVASLECCDAYGLLLNRVASELQAAAPIAITVKAKTRGQGHERTNSTTEDMALPLVRNITRLRVNTFGSKLRV